MNFFEWSLTIAWIAGIVVAKAGWSTFWAIFFPPWAIYVLIEHLFRLVGVL